MDKYRVRLLVVTLLASVAFNAGLLIVMRAQYVDLKVQAAQPYNTERFADENARIRATNTPSRRVVLFGDSRIAQWQPEPHIADGWNTVNRGISGETTGQMRLRFRADVLDIRPDVVVIQAGINDLVAASLAPPAKQNEIVQQCITNLRAFAEDATANGIDVVILTVFPPATPPLHRRIVWDNSIWSLVNKVNEGLNQLRSADRVTLIDATGLLIRKDGSWHEGATRDTLHLTASGYERLNAVVAPTLDRILSDAIQ